MNYLSFRQRIKAIIKSGIFWSVTLFIGVLLAIYIGINNVSQTVLDQQRQMIEDNLTRSVVQCYTLEGAYPQSLEYLIENYGFYYDDKYAVHYQHIGANILPEIAVFTLMEAAEIPPQVQLP